MSELQPGRLAAGTGTPALLGQMLLCSFLWAPAFLLMKRIGADISPLALTALRDVLGGGLMAFWFLGLGERILPEGREWWDWTILGVFQVIIPNTLTVYALSEITTSLASLIQASTPLIVAVIAPFFFASERMTTRRGIGILLGLGGLILLLGGLDLLHGQRRLVSRHAGHGRGAAELRARQHLCAHGAGRPARAAGLWAIGVLRLSLPRHRAGDDRAGRLCRGDLTMSATSSSSA